MWNREGGLDDAGDVDPAMIGGFEVSSDVDPEKFEGLEVVGDVDPAICTVGGGGVTDRGGARSYRSPVFKLLNLTKSDVQFLVGT